MKEIVGKIEVEGSCRKCGGSIITSISLGPLVQVNTGGWLRSKWKLVMPAYLEPKDHTCPHCGSNHFT